ncbi:hypothetical protein RB213_005789 [Colletotrichum asianum]
MVTCTVWVFVLVSSSTVDFLIVYYLAIALFYSESYNLLIKKDSLGRPTYVLRPDMPLLLQNILVVFLVASFGSVEEQKRFHRLVRPKVLLFCVYFLLYLLHTFVLLLEKRGYAEVCGSHGTDRPERNRSSPTNRTQRCQNRNSTTSRPRLSPGASIPYFFFHPSGSHNCRIVSQDDDQAEPCHASCTIESTALSADDWRRYSSQISDLIPEAHELDQDRKLIGVENGGI